MTREKAIEYTEKIFDGLYGDILDALKQPPTLAEFLGWRIGQLYQVETFNHLYKIEDDELYFLNSDDIVQRNN